MTDLLSRGDWQGFNHFANMNIVEYLNILSFELMKREERRKRLDKALIDSKRNPAAYQTALLIEILSCL